MLLNSCRAVRRSSRRILPDDEKFALSQPQHCDVAQKNPSIGSPFEGFRGLAQVPGTDNALVVNIKGY